MSFLSFLCTDSEPFLIWYKLAKIRDYDTDPEEHLARFDNVGMMHCYEDKVKYKAFLNTLVDSTKC